MSNACSAASTALLTSSDVPSLIWVIGLPIEGLIISIVLLLEPAENLLLINTPVGKLTYLEEINVNTY